MRTPVHRSETPEPQATRRTGRLVLPAAVLVVAGLVVWQSIWALLALILDGLPAAGMLAAAALTALRWVLIALFVEQAWIMVFAVTAVASCWRSSFSSTVMGVHTSCPESWPISVVTLAIIVR